MIAYLFAVDDYGVFVLFLKGKHIIVAEAEFHSNFARDSDASALAENLVNLVHV